MKSFLQNIAIDLLQKYGEDLHNITVVFPNKRAALFLNQELAQQASKPVWSPQYTTISELFQQNTSLQLADRIKLIFELYKSYCKVTDSKESLESFYGWGEVILSDFDDIDKHLADARKVFSLLGDIHELDDWEFLSDVQKKALQQFFRNFTKEHTTILKQRFLQIWSRFHDIYSDYQERLMAQNIAYEGMLYRQAINTIKVSPNREVQGVVVFVGFNHLTTVEEMLMAFYVNMTGGKVYEDHEMCMPQDLSFISSPTDDLQARYVSQWLTPERIAAGRKTAIVLSDEGLLDTVLHCLPEGISLNITTGYPLSQSPVTSLVRLMIHLLTKGHKSTNNNHSSSTYSLHDVNAVLRNPLTRFVSPKVRDLYEKLNKDLIYYLTPEELSLDDNLRHFFAPLKNKENVQELVDRLLWLTKVIATSLHNAEGQVDDDALTTEAMFRMYTLLNRLQGLIHDDGVQLDISLFSKLMQQIIQSTSIPFHGEPIEGIQVMGVLETRNLDFDHVLLLSCNEGNIPAKINDSSFLPHSIRIGFNLTTIENKVSIYEYYFERLLQRTKDVSITYNNATTDGRTGEMSRFMLQLLAEQQIPIKRLNLRASQVSSLHSPEPKQKTSEMLDALLQKKYISPSALGQYLRCPLRFYYQHVMGIREDNNNDEEEMDNMTFGTIFHAAAERLYSCFKGKVVPHEFFSSLQKEKGHPTLRRIVEEAFRTELFNIQKNDNRPTPKLGGLQVINFEMVVTFLLHLLEYDSHLTRLVIEDLEKEVTDKITIEVNGVRQIVRIGGMIDRLDSITEDGSPLLRVIDYKTGRLTKTLQAPDIESIFRRGTITEEKPIEHADYFLQALLYSYIIDSKLTTDSYQSSAQFKLGLSKCMSTNGAQELSAPNPKLTTGLLYVQQATTTDYDPLLTIGKERVMDTKPYLADFQRELTSLLSEIFNTDIPFSPTSDNKQCEHCSFKKFCH